MEFTVLRHPQIVNVGRTGLVKEINQLRHVTQKMIAVCVVASLNVQAQHHGALRTNVSVPV